MDPSLNTSDAVKELAIQGKFAEIESRFGKKRSMKAENYVAVDRFETKVSPFQRVGRICIVHVHI